MRQHRRGSRKGMVLAEAAFVYSAFLVTLIGGLSLGMGIFRHQEIAHLARESARWASLQEAPNRTPALIRSNVVAPKAVGVDPDDLTITTTPVEPGMAMVKIEYSWLPEFSPVPIKLTSTARVRIVE